MRIVSSCLLLAVVAVGGARPAAAAKHQKTDFRISITMESACHDWFELGLWGCGEWSGKFHATGAVSDRGSASAPEYGTEFDITLDGKKGSLTVVVSSDDWTAFEITGGTGAYAGATGGGAAEVVFTLLGDSFDPDHVRAEFRLQGTLGGG